MKLEDLPDDTCPWCGKAMPDTRRLGHGYCSRRCWQAHYDAEAKQARHAARAGRTCAECEGPIPASLKLGTVYCSAACGRLAMRKKTWGFRRCRICETEFLPTGKNQFLCVAPYKYMECVDRLKARLCDT